MKSGEDRNGIARENNIIAFEMEGAGIWDEVPCIIIKGVCDYADCHKNKKWQDFAAGTAAAAMKALLERYLQTDKLPRPAIPDGASQKSIHY
jgi:nucleoside phosphorylase